MNCPYCNAEIEDTADRCITCLKHLPHRDQTYTPTQASAFTSAPAYVSPDISIPPPGISQASVIADPGVSGGMLGNSQSSPTIAPLPNSYSQPAELLERAKTVRPNDPIASSAKTRIFWTAMGSAVAVGLIYFAISRVFEAFLVFPILAGICIGAITGTQIKVLKARNVGFAILCGFFAGILGYTVKTVGEAYSIRPDLVNGLTQTYETDDGLSAAKAHAKAEALLNPANTMLAYLLTYSVTISHDGSSSTDASPITGAGFWGLLGLECLIVAGFAAGTAAGVASAPFCESCQAWRKTEFVLGKHPKQGKQVVELVKRQDWQGIRSMPLAGKINDRAICRLQAVYCPTCNSGLVQVTSQNGRYANKLFLAEISSESMTTLRGINKSAPLPVAPLPASPA